MQVDSSAVDSPPGTFSIDRLRHSMRMSAAVEPFTDLVVAVPMSGLFRYSYGRTEASSVCVVPLWTEFRTEWDDIDVAIITLDLDAVRRIGAEHSGIDPASVTFTEMNPVSAAMGHYVGSLAATVKRHLLDDDALMASPLVREHAFRQLASGLLAAFPNSTHTLAPAPGADTAGPATVRRAVEFIDTHPDQAINLSEIAASAGIGPRGLQAAFRRHRDTTPLGYLRQVRLEHAHRDLAVGDPTAGDTVAAIAARWGFSNPGRFSVEYRQRFGEPPSTTLRR